jgi:pimeloyl-ACP methyl ester carboxylesterase
MFWRRRRPTMLSLLVYMAVIVSGEMIGITATICRAFVQRLLDGVETITLPQTGHFSSLERPAEVARILLQRGRE